MSHDMMITRRAWCTAMLRTVGAGAAATLLLPALARARSRAHDGDGLQGPVMRLLQEVGGASERERICASRARSQRHGYAQEQPGRTRCATLVPHRGGGHVPDRGTRARRRREATALHKAEGSSWPRRTRNAKWVTGNGDGKNRPLRRDRVQR